MLDEMISSVEMNMFLIFQYIVSLQSNLNETSHMGAHDKYIAKQNSEISAYVLDNDVIMLKFQCLVERHSTLKGSILVVCGRNIAKIGRVTN